jgi:hypothetical protein
MNSVHLRRVDPARNMHAPLLLKRESITRYRYSASLAPGVGSANRITPCFKSACSMRTSFGAEVGRLSCFRSQKRTARSLTSSAAARSFCVMPASVRAARSCRPVTRFLLRYINVSIQLSTGSRTGTATGQPSKIPVAPAWAAIHPYAADSVDRPAISYLVASPAAQPPRSEAAHHALPFFRNRLESCSIPLWPSIGNNPPSVSSPSPLWTREGSGMEGAHFSTVYRGLPVFGGQPLPHHMMPWRKGGSWSSLSLSPRSGGRAVGTLYRGKCRRCISGFVVGFGNPRRLIASATKRK